MTARFALPGGVHRWITLASAGFLVAALGLGRFGRLFLQRITEIAERLGKFRSRLLRRIRLRDAKLRQPPTERLQLCLQLRRVVGEPALHRLAGLREGGAELGAKAARLFLRRLPAEPKLVRERALPAFLQALDHFQLRREVCARLVPRAPPHENDKQPYRHSCQHEDRDLHDVHRVNG